MSSAKNKAILNPAFQDKQEQQVGSGVMCSALIVAAPHSGSGKTTVTAALARYHRDQGRKVTVFKVGPDFIDPMILRQASGELVYQLDLWLVGEQGCRALLHRAAMESDLILIEGVMGLFDGTPSSADLAKYFNIPVMGVIDAKAMAQTFAAVTFGLAKFCDDLPFSGVIANRVNTERHAELLSTSLAKDIRFYGRLPKDETITLPERHLGLVQAKELSDIDAQLEKAASHIAHTGLTELPNQVEFFAQEADINKGEGQEKTIDGALEGTRIIIVRDNAFSFIYAANIAFLRQAGAELIYCSALTDGHLPEGDILYIPGGYPELYAEQLMNNATFISDIRTFAANQKPIVAECGGMLYLLEQLTDMQGQQFSMAGLMPGKAIMQKKLAAIGSQWVSLPSFADNVEESADEGVTPDSADNIMRGHSFHYSCAEIDLAPISQTTHHPSERAGEFVYQHNNILASYMHWYFPSNPSLTLRIFDKARYL
ncbi:cobyrinate a,c-diamide synthase [Colwellia psychrerythraea]|uniref:Cobyrinic acid a,c-diamide synthase n=1 Tax=Colwellia psychrerythraea TaxID=28229 RepID=A0A099K906_COLPS|nr:cobyrinate a,c-diamide synthase [Colwellia psychrerythraea]KGJ87204.1 cobyrinic acid a,c-diamide synthase [Colwellia psychrerythraea]